VFSGAVFSGKSLFSAFLVCFASEFQCSCSIHFLVYVCIPYCHHLLSIEVD